MVRLERDSNTMPMALREITQAICYLLYMLLGRVLFPPIYLARVVDGRTHRPVAGVELVLEARDERMMLPGYPYTEAVSDSTGIITGVMAVGLGVLCLSHSSQYLHATNPQNM